MLKPVDNQQSAMSLGPAKPQAPDPAAGVNTAIRFAQQMQATTHRVGQETLVAFLAEIDEQGKRLAKSPIRAEIERYRALVGKFIKEATAQMTALEKRTDRRNRAFVLIKEVDKKLAELTDLLISGQAKQIDILGKLQEIQGMLVDLKIYS
jgi:uncharacterized protein YaaR (DUF327 family)